METCIYFEKVGKVQKSEVIEKQLYCVDEKALDPLLFQQKSVAHYLELMVDKESTDDCDPVVAKSKKTELAGRVVGSKMKRSVKKAAMKANKGSRDDEAED